MWSSTSSSVLVSRTEERVCQGRLVVGAVSRCCFRSHSGSVTRAEHGDDIIIAVPRGKVLKIRASLEKRWATRAQLIGAGSDDKKELHVLNRTLRWCRDGLAFAADVRHAKEVKEELGLSNPGTSAVV